MKWRDEHVVPSLRVDEETVSPLYSRSHPGSARWYTNIGTHDHHDDFGFSKNAGFGPAEGPQQVAPRYGGKGENHDDFTRSGIRDRRRRRRPRTQEEQESSNTEGLQRLDEALTRPHNLRPSHVELLERSAALKARMFGPQNSATKKALTDTIVACNSLAMSALGRGDTLRCKELLARAFEIACYKRSHDGDDCHGDDVSEPGAGSDRGGAMAALQVLTLNNTACLHRRLGEPKRALRYLHKAAELGRKSGGREHLDVTHLNACAVLSELGWHEEALEHARSAVFYGQEHEEVAGMRSMIGSQGPEGMVGAMGSGGRDSSGSRRARLATLAVSYYNLAVELEYTRRYDACLRWYSEAVKLARDPDVQNEDLVKTFQRSFTAARKKHACFEQIQVSRKTSPSSDDFPTRKGGQSPPTGVPGHGSPVQDRSRWSPTRCDDDPPRASYAGHSSHDSRRSYQDARHQLDSGAQWPHLGRAERQRAGDQRRSTTSGGGNRRQKESSVAVVASSGGYSWGNEEQLSRPRSAGREGFKRRMTQNSSTEQVFGGGGGGGAGAGGGGGGVGGGTDSDTWFQGREGVRRRGSRERPASAEVPREHRRERRRYLGSVSYSTIQEVSHAVREDLTPRQRQQSRGDTGVNAPYKSECDPRLGSEGGRRARVPRSRRPKSAYPRLEDQVRPGGSGGEISRVGCTENDRSDRGIRTERARSRSARSFGDEQIPTMSVSDGDGVDSRRNSRGRTEDENAGSRKRTRTAQQVAQVRKNIGRSDRSTRARAVGSEEGTEQARRWPAAGDWKRRQASAVSPYRGVECKTKGSADQAHTIDLATRPQQVEWNGHTEQGGGHDADTTASSRHTRGGTDSQTRKRGELAISDDGGGVCNGRDGKIYVDLEDGQDSATLMSVGRNATSFIEEKLHPEARVEVVLEEALAETTTQASAEETSAAAPAMKADVDPLLVDEVQRLDAAMPASSSKIDSMPRREMNLHNIAPESLQVSYRTVPMIEEEGVVESAQEDTSNGAKGKEAPMVGVAREETVREWSSSQLNVDGVSSGLSENNSAVIIQREIRCLLARRDVDRRRVLAAAAIKMWVFRVYSRRRQWRKRVRDLRRRWEREIRRIAATHIQALARGRVARRDCWRRMRAAREVQRVSRGRQGRRKTEELACRRCQDRHSACEAIQRLFRGHQGRRCAVRRWNIHWEATIACHGAATLIQHAWQARREMASAQVVVRSTAVSQVTTRPKESTSNPVIEAITGSPQRPSTPDTNENSLQELVRQSKERQWREEANASVYTLWGAFTSLLIAAATRRSVRRDVAAALLSLTAETLAAFSRQRHNRQAHESHSPSAPSSSSMHIQKPVPARLEGGIARGLERTMKAARSRLAGAARAWSASLSDVRAAARTLVGVVKEETRRQAVMVECSTEAAREEVEAIILEAVQESWTLLNSSGVGCLAGVEDGLIREKLTAMLARTLEDIVTDLGRIESLLCSPPAGACWTTCKDSGALVRLSHVFQTPATLVGALASSAAASLMCHSTFEEVILRHCSSRSLPAWDDDNNEGCDRLGAEAYGLVLAAPFSTGILGSNSFEEKYRAQQRSVPENSDGNSMLTAGGSLWQPTSCLRAQERSELLLSALTRVEETSEDIVRILNTSCSSSDSRYRKEEVNRNGFAEEVDLATQYDGAVQLLAENIWELAASLSTPIDEDQEDGALRLDHAASNMQNLARRQLARRRWARIRQQKASAIVAMQRCARRRAQRLQNKCQRERVRCIQQSLAATVSARAIEEAVEAFTARQMPVVTQQPPTVAIAAPLRDADATSAAFTGSSGIGSYAQRGDGRKHSVLRSSKTGVAGRLSKAATDRQKSVSFQHAPNNGGVWNFPAQSSRTSFPLSEFDYYPREHQRQAFSVTTDKDEEETVSRNINGDDISAEDDGVGATLSSTQGLEAGAVVDAGHGKATSNCPIDVLPRALTIPAQQQHQGEELTGEATRDFYLSPDTSSGVDTGASFPCLPLLGTRAETTNKDLTEQAISSSIHPS